MGAGRLCNGGDVMGGMPVLRGAEGPPVVSAALAHSFNNRAAAIGKRRLRGTL